MRDAFLQLYPGLLDFHERQRNLVRIHQEVRSPLGRLRHLPTIKSPDRVIRNRAERQSINSPIQSTLADMMEFATALIDDAFPNEEVQVVGNIHDALVAYIDEDKVPVILPQVIEIMSNLPLQKLGWNPPLKFTVDAEVGPDLAAVKKWKKAT
jgi:DNA polymerase I-like protein with 3'-5' exonuclease and polymerase domains